MKISNRLKVAVGMTLVASLFVSGCGNGNASGQNEGNGESAKPAAAKAITIKVANYFAPDHPQNVALREKFKPLVEKNSGGSLKVEIYENNKLGAEKEFYDGIRNGSIEMGIPGLIMQTEIEKLQVGELPFLIESFAHAQKVFQGPIGKELTVDLEQKHGVKALAWSANGFRMFSSNRPINQMSDFKGLRMRMPNAQVFLDLGKSLGMNVTPLPLSEVFTALEQKVVDGQDNPLASLRASGYYEVQTDVLESQHIFSPNMYIISNKFFQKLTPEQQKVVQEAATASAEHEWKLMEESYETDKKFLQEHKIKFTTPDDKFRDEMKKSVQPMYEQFYKTYPWGKEIIEKIQAEAKGL
ncbi:TRAP transporter substrate-binding protein [Paenibacillus validus]|nr:TRAP transporter substrate-binding protein [Paenibacillus validus]